jgi:N6-adenosine-specific RNA methylase IME4
MGKALVKSQDMGFLKLPGNFTKTSLEMPEGLSFAQWAAYGVKLTSVEGAVQWWLGDWWSYPGHEYGERKEACEPGGLLENVNFQTAANYGAVAKAVETSRRREALTFGHHEAVAKFTPDLQDSLLARAEREDLSVAKLRAVIARDAAFDRTTKTELDAKVLGKFVVLYADPPWQYDHAPLGGDNRAIENHYPTMTLEEICALPVGDIANENAVLFMWTTSPKLEESMQVLAAWGFSNRTTMVWIKDKIGMGYHVRERHEILLIAKRGELPPPATDRRPDSVVEAPRLEHSAKPPIFYELIDQMYPDVRKIELFGRAPEDRALWSAWGNQATALQAAE